jgi:hypothetical protein
MKAALVIALLLVTGCAQRPQVSPEDPRIYRPAQPIAFPVPHFSP